MRVMVLGLGYVGSVMAAGLAKIGHRVTGVDIDIAKVNSLRKGGPASSEPGLAELIREVIEARRLTLCHVSEVKRILDPLVMICADTPALPNGEVDLSQVLAAIHWINENTSSPATIIMKSTVPPGTGESLITGHSGGLKVNHAYVMDPEFLREGQALQDFFNADRRVLGGEEKAVRKVSKLYKNLQAPILATDVTSAEMIKYASNIFLAGRISFINEIARLCEQVRADIDIVARGIGLDNRIGPSFLKAGLGYGGSCLTKDTRAMDAFYSARGLDGRLLRAVIEINSRQRLLAVAKLKEILGNLKSQKIAVLGLAYKPDTDDIREAPALEIIRVLCAEGAEVSAYDPAAMKNAAARLPAEVKPGKSALEAVTGASAILLATEWEEFISLDWESVKAAMNKPYGIVDGRNCLPLEYMKKLGFKYLGFGRPDRSDG